MQEELKKSQQEKELVQQRARCVVSAIAYHPLTVIFEFLDPSYNILNQLQPFTFTLETVRNQQYIKVKALGKECMKIVIKIPL